jgi:hypothetical protein
LAALDKGTVAEDRPTPAARAFEPSRTNSTPASQARPRDTRSARRSFTTVVFSVSPSHSPTGTLVPSVVMARATTMQHSAKTTPSIIMAATSSSERSRATSSASLASVAALKRRDTADFEPLRATASSSVPMGSATRPWRRVATPASMRSRATWVKRSLEENTA